MGLLGELEIISKVMNKIVLIENTGKDFYNSRIRFATFLKSKGCDVSVIVPNDGYDEKIRQAGFNTHIVGQNIRGYGLINKLMFAVALLKILRKEKYIVVHCFRLQPNIIGGFVAGIFGHKNVINHITGLGIAFTNKSIKNKMLQFVTKFAYRFNSVFFKTKYIFQNKEDQQELGIYNNSVVILGSAVNEDLFMPKAHNIVDKSIKPEQKVILFVSRLIKTKGLKELVDAVQFINNEIESLLKLYIVGWIDEQNENSFNKSEIDIYQNDKNITFLGERADVDMLINFSDLCILPTYYREGTPRFLLEAMSCAKPIITTEMPGCNHLINPININGALVPVRDSGSLALAIENLLTLDLKRIGENGRSYYEANFSETLVYNSIYKMYNI